MDINVLEITSKNCYKWGLETIINSDGQYFWINLRDFKVETESKWLNIFNKHSNKSTLKYKRELTPDIKVQADKILVRNDLFEQVIKSCEAINIEFTMLKNFFLADYWYIKYYHDNTELNNKIFKAKAAYLLNDLDKQLIEKIFGHTFTTLVDKLINTVHKKRRKSNNY